LAGSGSNMEWCAMRRENFMQSATVAEFRPKSLGCQCHSSHTWSHISARWDQIKARWNRNAPALTLSREAAKEHSPRHKPWVNREEREQAPKGRKRVTPRNVATPELSIFPLSQNEIPTINFCARVFCFLPFVPKRC
jgi:hypothetical protein